MSSNSSRSISPDIFDQNDKYEWDYTSFKAPKCVTLEQRFKSRINENLIKPSLP